MIAAWSLLAYGTLLAMLGPRLLGALPAARTVPRLGAVVWQLAAVSIVVSWVLAGLAMATPVPALDGLGHLLTSCLSAFHDAAASPRSRVAQLAGLLVAGCVAGRAGGCLVAGAVTRRRRRTQHARMLHIVGRRAPGLNALVLEHPAAMAYCVPGRGQTVITRGALDLLSAAELAAVVAHERAHLRARHDVALTPVLALARAFPFVPLLAAAARELPVLLEMCADDAAARRHGRGAIAGALRSLSTHGSPEGTLAAGGSSAATRIDRLTRTPRRRVGTRAAFSSAALLLLAGPLVAAVAPVLVVALNQLGYCPVPPLS